jgi:chromosome segregation ATPase
MSKIPSSDAIQSMTRAASNLAAMSKIPSSDAIESAVRSVSNIQAATSNISALASSISAAAPSNILSQSVGVELLPETSSLSDVEVDLLIQELEAVRAENQRLEIELRNSDSEKDSLKQEVAEVRSQLETERADREEIEAELSELKQNSARTTIFSEKLTPDAGTILSKLRAKYKKSKTDLPELKVILEILGG